MTRPAIPDWPESDRPQQKLLKQGSKNLTDTELLAILIKNGINGHSAVDLGRGLLVMAGDLHKLSRMDPAELTNHKGIGPAKAAYLSAVFELSRRLSAMSVPPKLKISEPEIIFKRYGPKLSHLQKEVFMILALNSANYVVKDIVISEGILNCSLVHPREVFRFAMLACAASIILVHNHPSGDVQPSREDRKITSRLAEVGKLMNISVLDHVIVGEGKYFSFREAGLIGD